jgi:hypothetical protein
MRKRPITPSPEAGTLHDEGWLDLDRIAVVEVTSEEKAVVRNLLFKSSEEGSLWLTLRESQSKN